MSNSSLGKSKSQKNDEFYTQYSDIQNEVNAYIEYNPNVFRDKTIFLPCDDPEWSNFTKFFLNNFDLFGLKKLISTSFAVESKQKGCAYEPTLFEIESPEYDKKKTRVRGKIFERDCKTRKLKWKYLKGDGDFRSEEISQYLAECDIVITNPPFSLFREFIKWLVNADKKFLIIGNMNAITYKEVFPLIKENKLWLGNGFSNGNAYFKPYGDTSNYATGVFDESTGLVKFRNVCWFTNIEHGKRHQPMSLMTRDKNIKYSRHKEVRGVGYLHYDNYDAIEIPYTDSIPSDYNGAMGVPISFLDKYCPEQFEIIKFRKGDDDQDLSVNGKCPYFRILIRKKKGFKK